MLQSKLAQQAHGIDYLPGCVELGDFDATSTTIAIWPCGELHRLPRSALDRTFDRYWEQFVRRRDDPTFAWKDYTPYEVRVIGSLILLGRKEQAEEAMEFFLRDRRPPAWNQWPEVVYREPRTAQFVGDLPHTWCASDFINSVRMMFLHERESDLALVLLAGVPRSWLTTEAGGFPRDAHLRRPRIMHDRANHGGNQSPSGATQRFVPSAPWRHPPHEPARSSHARPSRRQAC